MGFPEEHKTFTFWGEEFVYRYPQFKISVDGWWLGVYNQTVHVLPRYAHCRRSVFSVLGYQTCTLGSGCGVCQPVQVLVLQYVSL